MRRRLRKFLPIVLIALTVQILAPIVACWAASVAASDPLAAPAICHDNAPSTQGQGDNQPGQPGAHDGCCSVCRVANTGAPVAAPQTTAVTTPYLQSEQAVWLDLAAVLRASRTGSQAQARAPPQLT
jgi:hypothetical protein